jgi:hypothetical protein
MPAARQTKSAGCAPMTKFLLIRIPALSLIDVSVVQVYKTHNGWWISRGYFADQRMKNPFKDV